MASGLKPLLLPRLVEERRKLEQQDVDAEQTSSLYEYHAFDSAPSSDVASPSPLTSSVSRTNHARLSVSASSSSLELQVAPPLLPPPPPCPDSNPASPTESLHATRPGKSLLPDVEEEPLEREEEEPATPPKYNDRGRGREIDFSDYCLCMFSCLPAASRLPPSTVSH